MPKLMRILLSVCLLVIATSCVTAAQQRGEGDLRLTRAQIKEAEKQLEELGYRTGPIDGVFDAGSRSALIAFQKGEGRETSGYLSVATKPASHGCIRIPMFAARAGSKVLTLGTIVLVYDKVSFVSAKEWIQNPKLKEAAMLNGAAKDYTNR